MERDDALPKLLDEAEYPKDSITAVRQKDFTTERFHDRKIFIPNFSVVKFFCQTDHKLRMANHRSQERA